MIKPGDAAVGKSAIVQMFHSKGTHYPKSYVMTTGCDFVMKELKVPDTHTTVELHIYDCSGQPTFTELTTQYVSAHTRARHGGDGTSLMLRRML